VKILYAASANQNAAIQLERFLQVMSNKMVLIKVAAYKNFSPPQTNIDWTLDCLYNIFNPDLMLWDNENLDTYYQQIKYYQPDLIISDLEYFTSFVATELNIPLWQCSSSLLNFAVEDKYHIGLFKNFSYLLQKNNFVRTQRLINIIDTAQCKLVYSHFGDVQSAPTLKKDFEWIRPYHYIGPSWSPCQHYLVAALLHNDKKTLSLLKRYSDCVVFTPFLQEYYPNISLKNLANAEEYACNVRNCQLFLCQGQTTFLADAFYNGKYALSVPDYHDVECVTNSVYSEYLGLGKIISQVDQEINSFSMNQIQPSLNPEIKFLDQKIREL
jgi:uncharacterized protein (TIGR00661 family)